MSLLPRIEAREPIMRSSEDLHGSVLARPPRRRGCPYCHTTLEPIGWVGGLYYYRCPPEACGRFQEGV